MKSPKTTKDLIALLLVFTFCIAVLMPCKTISSEVVVQLERILLIVIGFYFGHVITENNSR